MKKLFLIALLLFSSTLAIAQKSYTIDGQSIQLKTAVDGPVALLWNIIDEEYRYFIKTQDDQLVELINTKNANGVYQEQYKSALKDITNNTLDVSKLKLRLPSLARFIERYNTAVNPDYISMHASFHPEIRLGIFGGITNSPFVENPQNVKSAVFGAEVEMLVTANRRHSGYLQLRQVAEKDEFKYQTTELSLGYRYRFIENSRFSVYGDAKFATLNFTKATVIYIDENDTINTEHIDETAFDIPLIIGLGADVKLSNTIYANLGYNQIFAIFFKNQGNFSSDITLGLKFKIN
ncbi:outer membrane beta-barrel protein [Gelidibacter maritimus]|uniref:Outer membrane beta-barrel protein n=1 Tax=Gelidibacter maritimus TaxID=2761487 RepID=A0A7W2M5R8_9FLAO|nr:outer membrane beta-barrel protein [Gelidibacter maritimus]MBA6153152.1 outer membrane beta-barrel protein [Gelidibacter maritimus]